MIRLRSTSGEVAPLPRGYAFVEILSEDGLLGGVVISQGPEVIVAKPGDEEFARYCRSTGMRPAKHIDIEKPRLDTPTLIR